MYEVDDYLDFKDADEGKAAYQAASMYGFRHGVAFSMRTDEAGVITIWRVE